MEINKKLHWYHNLNGLIVGLGALFPVTYAVIALALPEDSRSELLSINPAAAIVAIAAGIYGIVGYPAIHKTKPKLAIIIGFVPILVATAIQILVSGGVESPYLIVWGLLVITSGIVGWQMILIAALTTNAYWGLVAGNIINLNMPTDKLILFVIFTQLPVIVALLISMLTHSEVSEKSISNLSDDLTLEQNKTGIVLQAIDDGVLVVNGKGIIEYLNPAGENITGWTRDEAINLHYKSLLNLKLNNGVNNQLGPVEETFKSGKRISSDDFRLLTKNQRETNLSLTITPLRAQDTSEGIVVVMRDISKEKAEEKRRQDFIATASHEMRTPIAQIKGYLELLSNPKVTLLDEKALGYVEKCHNSTEHLGGLFKDLLEVSKSDSGVKDDHPEVINLNIFTNEIIENHNVQAKPKGLNLSLEVIKNGVVEPEVYTYMDKQSLREVLDNLIGNAVKYTKEGFVKVTMAHTEEIVQIDIADSGIGIAREDMVHLFERFYRADSSDTREIGGTGLGLYLVKQIISKNNGKIWVDSVIDKGSTFHIQLPTLEYSKARALLQRKENL